MADFHPYQQQHRISRIYLKSWSFTKDNIELLTVFDLILFAIEEVPVDKFTTTINEFDLPSKHPIERRHYETTAAKVEGWYPMVLNTIRNQKRLTERHEDILRHFVSLLYCRSEVIREEFDFFLRYPSARDKFINEITQLQQKGDNPAEDILLALQVVKKEKRLALITGIITNHYARVFRSFSAVILGSKGCMSWLTTDLPVVIDKQENFNYLICWDSEVYFPLSPEYCLFLFHPKSSLNSNPLRRAAPNKIHLLDDKDVDTINQKILKETYRYLILPQQYKQGFVEELQRRKSGQIE